MTPDVNVLVAASRADHPHHRVALRWLHGALAACETGGSLELLPMVTAGFLRLVTHARVFPDPTPIADAVAFLQAILTTDGVELCGLGPEWPALQKLCVEYTLSGNQIPDAWIAAVVRVGGFHLVTFDHDFSRLLKASEYTLLAG